MGQAPSTRVHWETGASSETAYTLLDSVSDDDYSSAMAKQRESELLAERRTVSSELWALWKKGPPEIQFKSQEYDLAFKQIAAAESAKMEAPILDKLNKKKNALWAELYALIEDKPEYKDLLQALKEVDKKISANKPSSNNKSQKASQGG